MKIVNESEMPVDHRKSPKGAFELHRIHASLALGGIKDTGPWGGGQPFDVEIAILPPGKKNFPYHLHAAQTEYYIVLSGSGKLIDAAGAHPLRAGDHAICLPGEAHQIVNDSETELKYLVLSDHHRAEITTYPRTGRHFLKPPGTCVRTNEADYYEGEE